MEYFQTAELSGLVAARWRVVYIKHARLLVNFLMVSYSEE